MSKCRSCGAEIIWIELASGKYMPCDADKISYKQNFHFEKLTLITPEGKVTRGDFDPGSDLIGYTSHFATCPNANQHRRR